MSKDYTELCENLRVCASGDCAGCGYENNAHGCINGLTLRAAAAIEELQAENDSYFFKLAGVMLSVDKWLDGKELEQDEANRAATMREKTLRIVEKLRSELDAAITYICSVCPNDSYEPNCDPNTYCAKCKWRGLREGAEK